MVALLVLLTPIAPLAPVILSILVISLPPKPTGSGHLAVSNNNVGPGNPADPSRPVSSGLDLPGPVAYCHKPVTGRPREWWKSLMEVTRELRSYDLIQLV